MGAHEHLNPQEFQDDVEHWGVTADRGHESGQRLRAQMLLRADEAPTLYRGFAAGRPQYPSPDQFKPGSVLSLPMSSFSEDPEVSESFSWTDDDDDSYSPTTMEVTGARGIPISPEKFAWQKEWLSEGDFEIEDVEEIPEPGFETPAYHLRARWRHFGM